MDLVLLAVSSCHFEEQHVGGKKAAWSRCGVW